CSSLVVAAAGRLMPAALTSTSSRSPVFERSPNTEAMAASSARSHLTAVTCDGAVPLRLRPNTFAPLACRPAAMAAPMPRDAPVTTAVLPSSEKAAGLCIAVAAHDGRTELDVFRAIDLEHFVPLHQMHSDLAAEPVILLAQQRGN